MATTVLQNQKIWFHGYDISGYANALSLDYSADALDETVFGLDTRKFKGGLKTVAAGVEGFFDGTPDGALAGNIGASGKVLTLGSSGTPGDPVYMFQAMAGKYSLGATIGEMFGFSLEAAAQGKLIRGTLMENQSAAGSTANGTGRQLGAVLSTQRMYAGLHVLSAAGTDETLDVVIQSDDNSGFTTPTTRITFSQATGVTSEWKELAGAVTDDYWRAIWTIGGTDTPLFDFVVSLGIR